MSVFTSVRGNRLVVLISGALLLLFLGLIYAYSVLLAPLKAAFGWDVSGMTLVFAISIISFTVGGLVSGELVRRARTRAGLLLGAALLATGFLGASSVTGSASLAIVCGAYGVLASLGIGVIYNVVIPTVSAWFPDHCGIAQGICLMGFGLGGFVLGPAVTRLYAAFDWRSVLLATGVLLAALALLDASVMVPPSDVQTARLLDLSRRGGRAVEAGEHAVGVPEMLGDVTFRRLYAFLFLLGCIGMGVTGIGRELPLSLGATDVSAAVVIGFVNIGSGLGRLVCGMALDRMGRRPTMCVIAALGVLGPLGLAGSLVVSSLLAQSAACLVTGLGWGSAVVSMSYVTRSEWGQRTMARNLAIVNTYSVFASVVGSWGAGFLSQAVGSYYPALIIMAIMGTVAFALGRLLEGLGHGGSYVHRAAEG